MVETMDRKHWNLVPGISVGELEFGRDRAMIRQILGSPTNTFRKTASVLNTTDAYPSFHVYYSADDKLEAIEFFGKDIILSIDNQQIYPGTLNVTRKILQDLEEDYGTYISRANSIGVCIEEGSITSILVGCKDYYKKA